MKLSDKIKIEAYRENGVPYAEIAEISGGEITAPRSAASRNIFLFVLYARVNSVPTAAQIRNIAPVPVTENRGGMFLSKEKFQKVMQYQTVMAWIRSLLNNGIITKAEYHKIDTIMTRKYGISSCSIFR